MAVTKVARNMVKNYVSPGKAPSSKPYKIPAAPKSSGAGWGGEKPKAKKK